MTEVRSITRRELFYVDTRLTREEYVFYCEKYDITPIDDSELGDYGDRYGSYDVATYDTPTGIGAVLRQRRWFEVHRQNPDPVPTYQEPPIPRKEGQLWEPCKCGAEPVNMPLMLCDKCWPEGEQA
jgi:hypothetical protein